MRKNGEFVGVDEKFIPENEKYVDESLLGNKEQTKKTIGKVAKGFGIGYLVFIVIFLVIFIGMFIFAGSFIFKVDKTVDEQIDNFGSQTDGAGSFIDGVGSQIQSQINQQEVDSFNRDFEMYSGTSSRLFVTTLLDKVVTNNKKNSDKIITVIYNETTTTDPNEIVELKPSFEQGKDYEVMLDYGTNGLVNKVTIKDIK